MSRARLKVLADIAAVIKLTDLTALSLAASKRAALEARIAALEMAAREARSCAQGETDAGFLAAQESFGRLNALRRDRLRLDLDQAMARWAEQRDKAAKSFGRSQILDELHSEAFVQAKAALSNRD
ncbi:MAG: hypothetical protein WBC68_12810 [Albidovulum sp.]